MQSFQASRQGQVAAWATAVVNVLLTVGKGAIGLWSGSRALTADAVHSAADLVGSMAVIIGLRIARKPPDKDHPYGHGKAELISAAIVAVFLLGAGLDVGFGSVRALFQAPAEPRVIAAYTAGAAIVIKEVMFQYSYRLGKRLNSRSLLASAYDHRSDVFSSTAALAGVLMSLLGRVTHRIWMMHMDAVAGALVAVLVLKIGYDIANESLQTLMDRVVEGKDLDPYTDCIESIVGVVHIDELRVRDHGQYVIVDAKISVDANITVAAGHEIAADVKRELIRTFPRVQDVLVHVNPHFLDK